MSKSTQTLYNNATQWKDVVSGRSQLELTVLLLLAVTTRPTDNRPDQIRSAAVQGCSRKFLFVGTLMFLLPFLSLPTNFPFPPLSSTLSLSFLSLPLEVGPLKSVLTQYRRVTDRQTDGQTRCDLYNPR